MSFLALSCESAHANEVKGGSVKQPLPPLNSDPARAVGALHGDTRTEGEKDCKHPHDLPRSIRD